GPVSLVRLSCPAPVFGLQRTDVTRASGSGERERTFPFRAPVQTGSLCPVARGRGGRRPSGLKNCPPFVNSMGH
ncbi:hypothetical protein NDU88_000855, partial [Pleurodeles waltl]